MASNEKNVEHQRGMSISSDEVKKLAHSPVHAAVARGDHAALQLIISTLPRLTLSTGGDGSILVAEDEALEEEKRSTAISAVMDRRDVPNGETPLHVAVRVGDEVSAEMLMLAGADWELPNGEGWTPLYEALCNGEHETAMAIARHIQPMAWAKWRTRTLPRLVPTMNRMRDFYMEISFQLESSVMPFVSRIAPSDTFRIWKRGSNVRADLSFAGYDEMFRLQRCRQSILFLGEGSSNLPYYGCLLGLNHRDKEIAFLNDVDGDDILNSNSAISRQLAEMGKGNLSNPVLDLSNVHIVPHHNWRGEHKIEMVGNCRAKLYVMHNVRFSDKYRKASHLTSHRHYCHELSTEEKRQLESAMADGCFSLANNYEEDPFQHSAGPKKSSANKNNNNIKRFEKILNPVLYLAQEFPLAMEELLPVLDLFAGTLECRLPCLRELLTTKLPPGSFPVKVVIPLVASVKLVVTLSFNPKTGGALQDSNLKSWFHWLKCPQKPHQATPGVGVVEDPFVVPENYTWTSWDALHERILHRDLRGPFCCRIFDY